VLAGLIAFFVPDILRLALKKLKKRQNLVRFLGQTRKNECFFAFFETKYAFFEAFLGVKKAKNRVLSVNYVSETV